MLQENYAIRQRPRYPHLVIASRSKVLATSGLHAFCFRGQGHVWHFWGPCTLLDRKIDLCSKFLKGKLYRDYNGPLFVGATGLYIKRFDHSSNRDPGCSPHDGLRRSGRSLLPTPSLGMPHFQPGPAAPICLKALWGPQVLPIVWSHFLIHSLRRLRPLWQGQGGVFQHVGGWEVDFLEALCPVQMCSNMVLCDSGDTDVEILIFVSKYLADHGNILVDGTPQVSSSGIAEILGWIWLVPQIGVHFLGSWVSLESESYSSWVYTGALDVWKLSYEPSLVHETPKPQKTPMAPTASRLQTLKGARTIVIGRLEGLVCLLTRGSLSLKKLIDP